MSGLGGTLPAFADDGVITLTREVQPRIATRPPIVPDPNPKTANANPSAIVKSAVSSIELSDQEFSRISSGSGLQQQIMPSGQLPGIGTLTGGSNQSLPGMNAGHSGGSGNSISNVVNRSLAQGLAPLKMLTGDR